MSHCLRGSGQCGRACRVTQRIPVSPAQVAMYDFRKALNSAASSGRWNSSVTTEDKMIPPEAQHAMSKRAGSTVVEVKGSHAVYVSQPAAVAALIEKAAKGVKTAAN